MHGVAQRFALPALGWGRRSRPTGKMLKRRKLLEICAESPASGARFVGTLLTLRRLTCHIADCQTANKGEYHNQILPSTKLFHHYKITLQSIQYNLVNFQT